MAFFHTRHVDLFLCIGYSPSVVSSMDKTGKMSRLDKDKLSAGKNKKVKMLCMYVCVLCMQVMQCGCVCVCVCCVCR